MSQQIKVLKKLLVHKYQDIIYVSCITFNPPKSLSFFFTLCLRPIFNYYTNDQKDKEATPLPLQYAAFSESCENIFKICPCIKGHLGFFLLQESLCFENFQIKKDHGLFSREKKRRFVMDRLEKCL